jgi:hypothetical protein
MGMWETADIGESKICQSPLSLVKKREGIGGKLGEPDISQRRMHAHGVLLLEIDANARLYK